MEPRRDRPTGRPPPCAARTARSAPPPGRPGARTANQVLGALGEQRALEHYQRLGFRLVARNQHSAHGEIDLIVADATTLVFVEVKTRRKGGLDPLLSLNATKRRRMRRLAATWLASHPARRRADSVRLDAVAVVIDGGGRLDSLEQFEDVA